MKPTTSIAVVLFLSLLIVTFVRVFSLWTLSIVYSFHRPGQRVVAEKFSVIVPAFNEEVSIAQTIQSLLNQDYEDFEVVVVDDGSRDRTLEISRTFEGPLVRVVHQENGGKSAALNSGIAVANGTLILTVDADTRIERGALRALAARFSGHPDLGAVSGTLM